MSLTRHLPAQYQTGDVVADYERSEKIVKRTSLDNLRKHVAEMRLTLARSRIVCNCWHADSEESDAMWKIYAGAIRVMLVSTVGRLKAAIKGRYSSLACSPNPQEYVIATQLVLAERCQRLGWDISRDTLAKIESQTRWVADFELAFLAAVLRVQPKMLFPGRQSIVQKARDFINRLESLSD
jgi:hypothetical protein